jgi:predicted GNAT family N-acyltransferase
MTRNKPKSDIWPLDEDLRCHGYGSRILQALEAEGRRRKARKIVLNARENVVQFYIWHGYAVVGEAETFLGTIRHWRME